MWKETEEEKVYFMVGLIGSPLYNPNGTPYRFFKVLEFTKGKVYFELIDDKNLEYYKEAILVRDGKANMVHDNPEDTIKQLTRHTPDAELTKDNVELMKSIKEEIKRISETYKVELSKID